MCRDAILYSEFFFTFCVRPKGGGGVPVEVSDRELIKTLPPHNHAPSQDALEGLFQELVVVVVVAVIIKPTAVTLALITTHRNKAFDLMTRSSVIIID